MFEATRLQALRAVYAHYHTGRINRRQLVQRLGAFGLAAAALPLLGRSAAANAPTGGHGGHGVAAQEASPAATPVLGLQADGSRVWKVTAGAFHGDEQGVAEISAFLPGTITINAGDTIYFEVVGFHNIVFGAEGIVPLFLPADPALAPVATPPAAGADAPQLVFNPQVLFPAGGPTYDGTGFVNSGIPLDPSAPPFTLTFTTPGEYDYVCLIHQAHMHGKVIVQEAGAALPMEQDGVDAQAASELQGYVERAQALRASAAPAANEVLIGPGDMEIELMSFVPSEITIKAGEAVKWTYAGSMSPHTVTFLGGGAPAVEDIVFVPGDAGPPTIALNPNSFFQSDLPATYSGQTLVNSGYLGAAAELTTWEGYERRDSFELTFDTPGEYGYYCILHAGGPDEPPTESMTGKVIVTE